MKVWIVIVRNYLFVVQLMQSECDQVFVFDIFFTVKFSIFHFTLFSFSIFAKILRKRAQSNRFFGSITKSGYQKFMGTIKVDTKTEI